MEVSYKKDLRHNYMVIEDNAIRKTEPFSIKMLELQEIDGILMLEQKHIDNRTLYYYEITSKQSMINILDKSLLSYHKTLELCSGIIQTIERAYEYLLPEDDFMLTPEYIYIDVATNAPCLCYFPGYGKCIKDQMNAFLEYLMNKVDYNDKDAVILVYQLYAASKEEGYTFDHLKAVLQNTGKNLQTAENQHQDKTLFNKEFPLIKSDIKTGHFTQESNDKSINIKNLKEGNIPDTKITSRKVQRETIREYRNEDRKENRKEDKNEDRKEDRKDNMIPVVMEKVEGEMEVPCYSIKTFIYSGSCILGGVLMLILSMSTKIIYNTFGNRIDYSKLFALLLIILCAEGYLLNKLLDKKNKVTKIIKTREYIDPRVDNKRPEVPVAKRLGRADINNVISPLSKESEYGSKEIEINEIKIVGDPDKLAASVKEEDFEPTCLLNEASVETTEPILKALDEANYKNIPISSVPFFIGKLRKNVDYCLEKDVVSRYHAKITKEGDSFYLTDLNSTNGTSVNKELLQTYQKKEINFGDEIAFANIKFQFVQQLR